MNQRNDTRGKRSKWSYALALLWLAACGGAVGKPSVGGESHFLRHCGDGCGPGLECVADVCTRGCRVDADDCSDLAARAQCTNTSLEPGTLAICDVACAASGDCRALGLGFTCDSGYCRGPIPTEPGPGGGGSSSMGGSTVGGSTVGGSTVGGSTVGGSSSMGGSSGGGGSGSGGSVCSLPFVLGPCDANFSVFAFIDGACQPATYGGCEGNENRFETLEECQSRCGGGEVPAKRCLLPFDGGPCEAAFDVFAFDGTRCVPQVYGGCQGNDNRFTTLEECLNVCEGQPAIAPCPEGRVAQEICAECGPAGGCGKRQTLCAQPCEALDSVCEGELICVDGFCQVGRCI